MSNLVSLKISDLSYTYGEKEVFTNLSFLLKQGDFTILMGANGAGKSTLLKLITRSLPIQKGTIELFGQKLARKTQKYIGYVPQSLTLQIPNFPIRCSEFLYSSLISLKTLARPYTAKEKDLAKQALDLTATTHLQNKLLTNLSGGEKQRLLLARAILKKPKLLLLDEPFNHLDYKSQQIIHATLQQLNQEGTSILLISHSKEYAIQTAKSVLFLDTTLQEIDPQTLPLMPV